MLRVPSGVDGSVGFANTECDLVESSLQRSRTLTDAERQHTDHCTCGGASFHGVVGAGAGSAGASAADRASTFGGPITCGRAVPFVRCWQGDGGRQIQNYGQPLAGVRSGTDRCDPRLLRGANCPGRVRVSGVSVE